MSKKWMTDVLLNLSHFADSTANFIVGCKLVKTFFKALRSNAECHGRKPSSIYVLSNSSPNLQLLWEKYFGGSTGNKTISCKNPIERLAYGHANFVPTAVPIIWLKNFPNKIKLLFFNINSTASKINSLLNLIEVRYLCFVM